jgi:hypothetical protein
MSLVWGAVKSLRGKKDKLPELSKGSQDDSNSPSAEVEESESDSELEKRVKQWLSESSHPKDSRAQPSGFNNRKSQDGYFAANRHLDGAACDVARVHSEIYHPDFVDWAAAIQPTQEDKTIVYEKNIPDDLLQVLEGTTASISQLLSTPFCTFLKD